MAIVDFRKEAPQGPSVEFRITPAQITAELAQAGFQLQVSHDFLPQQLMLIYRVKQPRHVGAARPPSGRK